MCVVIITGWGVMFLAIIAARHLHLFDRFLIGDRYVKVGVVVFSDRAAIAIALDNVMNKEQLLTSISTLDRAFLGGGVNMAEGFRLLNTVVCVFLSSTTVLYFTL